MEFALSDVMLIGENGPPMIVFLHEMNDETVKSFKDVEYDIVIGLAQMIPFVPNISRCPSDVVPTYDPEEPYIIFSCTLTYGDMMDIPVGLEIFI